MLHESFRPSPPNVEAVLRQRVSVPNRVDIQTDGVRSLSDFFLVIETYASQRRWWFRGEAMQYEYSNLPKFSRDYYSRAGAEPIRNPDDLEHLVPPQKAGNGKVVCVSCMTKQEKEIIENFRTKPPDDEYFEKLVGHSHRGIGWLSYAQHYGTSTRLLDVSSDPLVALYFACISHPNENGFIWLFPIPTDIHQGKLPDNYEKTFDVGTGDAAAQAYHEAGSLSEYRPHSDVVPMDQTFLLKIEKPNRRVIAQRGQFLWSAKPLQSLTHNGLVVMICAEAKAELLAKLSAFGIHSEGLCLD